MEVNAYKTTPDMQGQQNAFGMMLGTPLVSLLASVPWLRV
jgi:hypothetical protein